MGDDGPVLPTLERKAMRAPNPSMRLKRWRRQCAPDRHPLSAPRAWCVLDREGFSLAPGLKYSLGRKCGRGTFYTVVYFVIYVQGGKRGSHEAVDHTHRREVACGVFIVALCVVSRGANCQVDLFCVTEYNQSGLPFSG